MNSAEKTFNQMSKKELIHQLEICSGRTGDGFGVPEVASLTMKLLSSELDRDPID